MIKNRYILQLEFLRTLIPLILLCLPPLLFLNFFPFTFSVCFTLIHHLTWYTHLNSAAWYSGACVQLR